MFLILSKILLVFISPFTWILAALGFAFFSKNSKWKKRSRIAAIVMLVFFSNDFIFLEVMRKWEIHGTPVSKVKHHDVGIVLTGMAVYNNDLKDVTMIRGTDRIWKAITLYKTGKIDKILITGDNGYITDKGLHEAQQIKDVLKKWKFPENDIIVETVSRNTHENAVETKKLLTRSYPQYNSFLLITSGRHMRRSLGCFEHEEMKVTPFATDLYTGPTRSYTFDQLFIPDVSTLYEWNGLFKEIVGYIAYSITGKI